ncbi:MAG TPA: hypothetical protein VGQ60_01865 [Nitrospiraceae bacterium]|jgi:hypothetical protein|nr:hypothetical protein [Nitrospiraceae bacterium]
MWVGWCVSGPVVELQAESPPPLRYAPADRHPLDEAACRAKLASSAAQHEENYRCLIDFARLEQDYPLTPDDLKRITRDNIKAADQEQLDQIYARLTAGAVPDGPFAIELFSPRDFGLLAEMAQLIARERMDPLKGLALLLSMPERERGVFVRLVWQGKVFLKNRRIVLTRIGDVSKLAALIPPQPGQAPATKPLPADRKPGLLFPAKVYCGQSLLDGRRESIIIDYTFSHDISKEYRKDFVWMMGPNGLGIRDELRMIRPGFYLGRAYLGRIFAVNFILYSDALVGQDGSTTEDCEIGSQRAAAAAR